MAMAMAMTMTMTMTMMMMMCELRKSMVEYFQNSSASLFHTMKIRKEREINILNSLSVLNIAASFTVNKCSQ